MTTQVVVNGFDVEAVVDRPLLDDVLVPRLAEVGARVRPGRRNYVFLVAPPGAGKSTLAALLVAHATHLDLATVGIDGFHHPQSLLESRFLDTDHGPVRLDAIKGAPETFDVAALAGTLEAARTRNLTWPAYDRTVHDVVPGREPVRADLVVVEGNWLLLDEPGWSDLSAFSALTIFVEADPVLLRDRLIDRKVRGGLDRSAATAFYERSDRPNVDRVLTRTDRSKVDLTLHLHADGTMHPGGFR